MKYLLLIFILLLIGCGKSGIASSNPTRDFLGSEEQWSHCKIELEDIQGLFGGAAIYLDGTGQCLIRIVGLKEKRFSLKLSHDEAMALRMVCIDADILSVQIKARPAIPDEARPIITLRNASGEFRSIAILADDKVDRFDNVYQMLLDLRKKTQGLKADYDGDYQPEWKPIQKTRGE